MKQLPRRPLVVTTGDDPEFYLFAEQQSALVVRKNGIALRPAEKSSLRRDLLLFAFGIAAGLVITGLLVAVFGN